MSRPLAFWGSAAAVALCVALAAALLLPYEALQLRTEAARWRAWLLTVWTGGAMAVLFGLSGLLGVLAPVGLRDVVEAGSVTEALRQRRAAARGGAGGRAFHGNFAWWLVATGALMIAIYFAGWTLLRV